MDSWVLIAAVAGVAALIAAIKYKRLIRLRRTVDAGWAGLTMILQQRHEDLTRLVTLCEPVMDRDRKVVQTVLRLCDLAEAARLAGDLPHMEASEKALSTAVDALFAHAQAYPEVQQDKAFQSLRGRLASLDLVLSDHQDVFNRAVHENNADVGTLTGFLVARLCGFGTCHSFDSVVVSPFKPPARAA